MIDQRHGVNANDNLFFKFLLIIIIMIVIVCMCNFKGNIQESIFLPTLDFMDWT